MRDLKDQDLGLLETLDIISEWDGETLWKGVDTCHGLVQIVLLAEIVLALKTRDPTFGREDIGYKIGDILTEAELMQCAERALAQVEAGVLTTAALGEPIPLNLQ